MEGGRTKAKTVPSTGACARWLEHDAGEGAGARPRRAAQHPGGDAADVRAGQRRGGDRVVARPQRRQHVQVHLERQRCRPGTPPAGPAASGWSRAPARGRRVPARRRRSAPSARLLRRVLGVLGERWRCRRGSRRPAARRSWPARRAAGRARRSAGGCGAAVRDDREVLPGVQPEAGHHPADGVDPVARQHPEVVARPGSVAPAGQRDLDVARGPLRRLPVVAGISSRFARTRRRAAPRRT